jgi:hypothetical protein
MLTATAVSLAKRFHESLGFWPDLEDPRTLQEKILWRKLYEDMSEAVRLADKVAVRDYVRDVVGEEYLVEALAIVKNANDLDFEALPASFVIKVNNGSGSNIIVHEHSELNVASVRRIIDGLLRFQYGRRLGEHWYAEIEPQVLVERLLVDREHGVPIEYRFHVFHGKAEFVQVVTSRAFTPDPLPGVLKPSEGHAYVGHKAVHSTYGMDWQPAPFHFRSAVQPTPKLERTPGAAGEMVEVAEKLAGDWGYVRVDLYCIDDRHVYFGEMTFAHNSGLFLFRPEHWNEHFGSLWDIRRRYVRERRTGFEDSERPA